MAVYSHSRLSVFEQCPYRYKLKYIDKVPPVIKETIEAFLGKIVHSSLEWFHKQIMENKTPKLDELIKVYLDNWQKSFHDEIHLVKRDYDHQDYLERGVKFLIDYYNENYPFDENIIALEKRVKILLDEERKHWIIGYIDKLVYNEKTGEYEVHDYKTANSLPTIEKIENDRQLALYALAVKELFGEDKEVKLIWHYLSFNKKIYSRRTNNALENLKKEILKIIEIIESTKEFPPNPSILCEWCEYKPICPFAKRVYS